MADKVKKEYNMMSHMGLTDAEYITEFKLDPAIANTPEINEVMIARVYQGNLDSEERVYISQGMSADKAKKEAKKFADKGRKEAYSNLQKLTKLRGY